MVKMIYCLRRLPDLSLAEFQRYWRENHGPLVRSRAAILNIRRYVQNHTIYDENLGRAPVVEGRPEPYDGVAELWWDSLEDFMPQNPTSERQQAGNDLTEDEKNFIDHSRSPVWLAEEHVFIDDMPLAPLSDKPSPAPKLIYCGHFLPRFTREEAQRYWREEHGPLVRSVAETLRIRRYVQNHTIYNEPMENGRIAAGRPEPYDGVAELWWDSLEDHSPASPSAERQEAGRKLFEDEQKFVDHPRSPAWMAREIVFVDNR